MKLNNFLKINSYSLYVTLLFSVLFVSCGTYQSVYTNDGIYDDEPIEEEIIIVASKRDSKKLMTTILTEN